MTGLVRLEERHLAFCSFLRHLPEHVFRELPLEFAQRSHAIINPIEQNQNGDAGNKTKGKTNQQTPNESRPNGNGRRRHFHDRDLISRVDHLRDIDFLEVGCQSLVEHFQPIYFAFDAIELCQPLTQIERLGFPLFDVGPEIFHLFADGFTPGLELLDRITTIELDQFLLLRNLVSDLDDLGMFGPEIL